MTWLRAAGSTIPSLRLCEASKQNRFDGLRKRSICRRCSHAAAPIEDQLIQGPLAGQFSRRLANAETVRRIAKMTNWIPFAPSEEFRSAAVLVKPASTPARAWTPAELRECFHRRGVALTSYQGGLLRLSMPSDPIGRDQAGLLIPSVGNGSEEQSGKQRTDFPLRCMSMSMVSVRELDFRYLLACFFG